MGKNALVWDEPIYQTQFVAVQCSREKAAAEICKHLPKQARAIVERDLAPDKLGYGKMLGVQSEEGNTLVCIWMHPEADVSVAAHEALHAASFVLGCVGLKLTPESDEAYAYYVQHVVAGLVTLQMGNRGGSKRR